MHQILLPSEILKFNSVNENILIQSEDNKNFVKKEFKVVSKENQQNLNFDDLIFAFNVCQICKIKCDCFSFK